jgi:hypothetical protein
LLAKQTEASIAGQVAAIQAALAAQAVYGQSAQLVGDQRQELSAGRGVAGLDAGETGRPVVHRQSLLNAPAAPSNGRRSG